MTSDIAEATKTKRGSLINLTVNISVLSTAMLVFRTYYQRFHEALYDSYFFIREYTIEFSLFSLIGILVAVLVYSNLSAHFDKSGKLYKFFRKTFPAILILLSGTAICLAIFTSVYSGGRIGGFKIAIMSDNDDSVLRREITDSILKSEEKTGQKLEYATFVNSTDHYTMMRNLKEIRSKNYDVVFIDDPKFYDFLRDEISSETLSRYSVYISLQPKPRNLPNHLTVLSVHPKATDLVKEAISHAQIRSDSSLELLRSDGTFGALIHRAASIQSAETKEDNYFVRFPDHLTCIDATKDCGRLLGLIDPLIDLDDLDNQVANATDVFMTEFLADRLSAAQLNRRSVSIAKVDWDFVAQNLLQSHVDAGRPVQVSKSIELAVETLWRDYLIELGDNGTVAYRNITIEKVH